MPYTKQNIRVPAIHVTPTFSGASGTALTAKVTSYIERILVNDADANDIISPQQKVIFFDLLDATIVTTDITAAGKTVTYQQLAALLRQAVLDQATAQNINA
jgi:hypothetical protein